jgi:hypothetical protein
MKTTGRSLVIPSLRIINFCLVGTNRRIKNRRQASILAENSSGAQGHHRRPRTYGISILLAAIISVSTFPAGPASAQAPIPTPAPASGGAGGGAPSGPVGGAGGASVPPGTNAAGQPGTAAPEAEAEAPAPTVAWAVRGLAAAARAVTAGHTAER